MKKIVTKIITLRTKSSKSLFEIFQMAEEKLRQEGKKPLRMILLNFGPKKAQLQISFLYEENQKR